jgi:integrase
MEVSEMGRKRTGTAWQKSPGVWIAAITLADGTRLTQRMKPRPNGAPIDKAYADARAREWQRAYDEGEWSPPPKALPGAKGAAPVVHTVGSWAAAWAKALTIGTAADVRYAIARYVEKDPIAAVPLRALSDGDLALWVGRLKASKSRFGGTLAPMSVGRYFRLLHQSVKDAVRAGLLERDPFERLPQGIVPAARDKVPGARMGWGYESAEILALVTDPRVPADRRMFYAIAFMTGPRAGEISALRWSDWARDAVPLSRLTFARTMIYRRAAGGDGDWERVEKETKTGAVKEAPVHPALHAMLSAWWATGWREHQGRDPEPRDLIVPNQDGLSRVTITSWGLLQDDCRTLGIRRRRLHGTRHTMIRAAGEGGAARAVVRGITHASVSRDVYDGYDRPSWERVCREYMKVELALPAAPSDLDSAPDSAPAVAGTPAIRRPLLLKPMFCARRSRWYVAVRNRRWHRRWWGFGWPKVDDSAPDSATAGALSGGWLVGEVVGYAMLERAELEGWTA